MFGLIKKIFIKLLTNLVKDLIIQNMYPYVIKNSKLNLLLLVYILMNTIKNYTAIHLQLI